KGVQLVNHAVDRVLQIEDLAADVDGDLLGEVALGDGGRHLGDVAHVRREIAGHEIDVVGEVFPNSDHALHLGLAAQLALGTDFARPGRDFGVEGVELVDHDVDGVLQLEDLALHLDRDLFGEVAFLHRGRDLGDVAHLGREVGRELIHLQGQVFPGPGRPRHAGLTAQPALGAHFARHPADLAGEGVELVDHRVDRVLEPEDLAANVDRDLFREVAPGDRGRDLRDVAHLGGQVAGHVVDVVRQVLPNTGDAGHLGLAAELPFRTDLAGDPRDLAGEGVQLLDHDREGVLELEDFAADFDCDLLGQVALGDGGRDVGDVAHLSRKVGGHQVDVVGKVLPDPGRPPDMGLPAQLPVGADFLGDTRDFEGEGAQLLN